MSEIYQKFKVLLKKVNDKGFFGIFISSMLVKVASFMSAMFLPRFLTVQDYGLLSYAETILTYFLMVNALNMTQATLKFCSTEKNGKDRQSIFFTTTLIGIVFDILLTIFFFLFIVFSHESFPGSSNILTYMIFIPLVTFIFQNIQFYLRANFENTKYSGLSVFYTLSFVILQIILAIIAGIKGVVLARYLSYFASILLAIYFFKSIFIKMQISEIINRMKKLDFKKMIVFATTVMVGNFFSVAVANNEIFILSKMFSDVTLIAEYRVASYILPITLFMTDALLTFIIPYFSKHEEDKEWIWKHFKKIYKYNFLLTLFVVSVLFVFSKTFILIFFGNRYLNAVPIMRVLLLAALAQSGIKSIPGMILGFTGQEKYNLYVNLLSFVLHIAIEFVILRIFGLKFIGVGLIFSYSISGLMMYLKIRTVCLDK